jgi:hypothetical protein
MTHVVSEANPIAKLKERMLCALAPVDYFDLEPN